MRWARSRLAAALLVAAALLLLGGCEHRQDRPVQLLVGRQAAGRAGGRNAGGRGTTGAAGRHVVAATQRWRGGAAGRSLVLGAGAERSAADRRGAGLRRESLDRCGIGALRHHHHHTGVAALGNALGGGALLGTRYLGTGDAETAAFLVGHRSTGIHHRDRPVLRAGAAREHGTAGKRGEYENLLRQVLSDQFSQPRTQSITSPAGFWLPQPGPWAGSLPRI